MSAAENIELELSELNTISHAAADNLDNDCIDKIVFALKHNISLIITNSLENETALTKQGFSALGEWHDSFTNYANGADVVILVDNCREGTDFSAHVVTQLKNHAFSIRNVIPSDDPDGTVKDYLNEHTKNDLLELILRADEEVPCFYIKQGNRRVVNSGLFADHILNHNHIFKIHDPGSNTDDLMLYKDGVYSLLSESELKTWIRSFLPSRVATPTIINNTSQMVIMTAEIKDYEEINADESVVNIKGGLFYPKKLDYLPHDPTVLSTLQLNINNVRGACPNWSAFINQFCTDNDGQVDMQMVNLLQEWTGFILSNIHGDRIKRALVLHAAIGNSGKSVFIQTMCKILGKRHVVNTDLHQIASDRWGTGRAFGKRLIAIGDQDGRPICSSQNFKFMTGGDGISAEKKGIQGFDYVFHGVFLIGSNFFPIFEDDKGTHIVERLVLIPCRHTVPKEDRDPEMLDKLLKEKEGIFMWAMEGLFRFINNGMQFSECVSSDNLTNEYRSRYDTLYDFISQECVMTLKNCDTIKKADFEAEYFTFCNENDLHPLSKKNIQSRLESYGVTCSVLHGYKVYRGIKARDWIDAHDAEPFEKGD